MYLLWVKALLFEYRLQRGFSDSETNETNDIVLPFAIFEDIHRGRETERQKQKTPAQALSFLTQKL
ncbi:CLUMA_CG019753, isoform A [Clunio marinus]|uniref:CLUMA_CG019753, isoform A n=1 Tax=Clunio marinus TaxID=568069 RepID=A0A1J1J268_9DIPT|nr:CLUMA_CG019753, isoform A [Clunio marinus]